MSNLSRRALVLIVVLIGFIWRLNWPAVKFILTEIPPLALWTIAFLLAAASLTIIAYIRNQNLWPNLKTLCQWQLRGYCWSSDLMLYRYWKSINGDFKSSHHCVYDALSDSRISRNFSKRVARIMAYRSLITWHCRAWCSCIWGYRCFVEWPNRAHHHVFCSPFVSSWKRYIKVSNMEPITTALDCLVLHHFGYPMLAIGPFFWTTVETELAINPRSADVIVWCCWSHGGLLCAVGSSSLPIARNGCRNRDIAYANCWSFICHFSSQRSDNMAKHLFLLMILISIVLALTYQRTPDV